MDDVQKTIPEKEDSKLNIPELPPTVLEPPPRPPKQPPFRLQKGMILTVNKNRYKVIATRPNGKATIKLM